MPSSFPVKSARFLFAAILLTGITFQLLRLKFRMFDSIPVRTNFNAEEIVRAERLFYGLAYPAERSVNCVKCHNTRQSDTLNWNPDALEISRNYLNKSPDDLSGVLLRPKGKKMAEVHKGFQLTNEDVVLIKAFMTGLLTLD